MMPSSLELALLSVAAFFLTAFLAPFLSSRQNALLNTSFSLMAIACLIGLVAGVKALAGDVDSAIAPVGLPELPFYLRLDELSGFFVALISLIGFFVSIYSLGYLKGFIGKRSLTPLVVFTSLFMAGMLLVTLADDAFFFMISWELMAAASFFLVVFEDERAENRRAAFLYLLIAHVGAIAILLSFGVMAGGAAGFESFSGYTFSAMRGSKLPAFWAGAAFLLALFGFGAKAGLVPMHVWLPEAHPVAPSNISALMSAVMLKTAVYGVIRVSFDLLSISEWWWGGLVLALGLVSAVMGILYAIMQGDLKRMLAYSSVENIGVIFIPLGLAMIFTYHGFDVLSALALTACLYHALNHAVFKSLLFMCAGAVLHATNERGMERMGGLIRRMPWTAVFFLIGCASIASLPPFNGFVSEWLIFQSFLLSPAIPGALLKLLIPLGAALLALTAALVARCFVKAYGIVFLGQARSHAAANAHEVDFFMRAGMFLAAAACVFLGVLPAFAIKGISAVTKRLVHASIALPSGRFGWMWLTPVAPERASYSAPIVFIGIASVVAIAYLLAHARPGAVRRAPPWDCGFEKLTPRMQYSAASFSMPIRRVFGGLFAVKSDWRASGPQFSEAYPTGLIYRLRVRDRLWAALYKPISEASFWAARKTSRLQRGRIQTYILYMFITIVALLMAAS